MTRRLAALAAPPVALLVLAGCGDDGGDTPGPTDEDTALSRADEVSESAADHAAQVLDLGEFGDLATMDRHDPTGREVDDGRWRRPGHMA
jgi:hypothetical protein